MRRGVEELDVYKQERPRVVQQLPRTGRLGDTVEYRGELYSFADGVWQRQGGLTNAQANQLAKVREEVADIEPGAEVNPSAAEIKQLYESNANTNAFTDALLAKLQSDVTPSQLTSAIAPFLNQSEVDTRALAVITAAIIKTRYESNADTNAYTDDEKSKLANISPGAGGISRVTTLPTAANAALNLLYLRIDTNGRILDEKGYIKSFRARPFFTITAADLGGGHLGAALSGYNSLDDGYAVNQGGTKGYTAIGAISEQLRNLVSTTFERVGTYTFPSTIRGLAAHGENLYQVKDLGTTTEISWHNPDDGTEIGSASVSAVHPEGFTILNGIGYFYNREGGGATDSRRFYSFNIASETFTSLSTQHSATFVFHGLANANGNVYVIYIVGGTDVYVAQLNTTNGALSSAQLLSGYESDDAGNNVEGFTSVDNVLYVSTEDSGDQNPHLYSLNPSNGNLTVIGDISPSNAGLDHLAQLEDYIYAWNDTDNGIYRSEIAIGNRWIAIFPNTTTEVSDSDTTLRLFPSLGGTEVALTRDTDITDAIVFRSIEDGATAHTISVGDSLNIALYNSENEQLYEGANEAILARVAITTPIGV